MTSEPLIIRPSDSGRQVIEGSHLVIGDYPASGAASEVAPLHVLHEDDEAWHVISGALRFRFEDRELIAEAGSTVLVPAGMPHTFGDAGPARHGSSSSSRRGSITSSRNYMRATVRITKRCTEDMCPSFWSDQDPPG